MRLGNIVRRTSLISQKIVLAVMLDADWLDRRQAGLFPWWVSLRDDEWKPYLLQLQLALSLPHDVALF